jgi:hypothetical protein
VEEQFVTAHSIHETVIVVDGSNAAAGGGCRAPSLARMVAVRAAALAKWPLAKVVVVVDANLRHALTATEGKELASLCRDGDVISVPSCTLGKGDGVILAIAATHGAMIVSNDEFREFIHDHPFITDDARVFGIVCVDGFEPLLVQRKLNRRDA